MTVTSAEGSAGTEPGTTRSRKRDAAATRLALLEAARTLLGERGVEGASTRDVAAAVGVNQALVYRYFGSKEQLFAEAAGKGDVDTGPDPMAVTPLDELPRLLLGRTLDRAHRDRMTLLVSGANDRTIRSILRERIEHGFGEVLASRLPGPDAALRAELFAALMAGIGVMREKVGTEAMTAAGADELGTYVDRLAAALFADPSDPATDPARTDPA